MGIKIDGIFRGAQGRDIVHRWEGNPLFGISDLSFNCSDILNAGVVTFQENLLLLVTIESLAGQRCVHLAQLGKGGRFEVDSKPFLKPSTDPKFKCHESGGILDARVTFLEGNYYIVYDAFGEHGYRLAMARTKDFKLVERLGLISEPDTKAGALFPEKIGGRYARLERPTQGGSIWITYSDDLTYWGGSEVVIGPRGGYWDSDRVGAGAVPMEIEQGWLLIYYGAKDTSAGPVYRIGAVILDRNDPTKVVGRSGIPILAPRENYERLGDVANLVFSTGAVIDNDEHLHLFYGAADSCICLGTTTVKEIVDVCMEGGGGG